MGNTHVTTDGLEIGSEIAGFRILEKLGEGGMGVVYKAIDTSLDRLVAIKVLSPQLAGDPELVQRFRSEARAQANLNHTNLATLYAFVVRDGAAMMAMEFIDGETVEQTIYRGGPIPSDRAIPLFRQALLGIGYAHRMGVIHRDIKPSNIMVNRSDIVKVMDFGIAKIMGVQSTTRTGTQMGTSLYMPPEQVLNRPVDIRSDIYSLGVTLYQMLCANVPFDGDSDYRVMWHHVNTPPAPPRCFNQRIPEHVENAVMKALEKNPDARFQTVEEFGAALEGEGNAALAPHPIYAPAVTVLEPTAPIATPTPTPLPQLPVRSSPLSKPATTAQQLQSFVQTTEGKILGGAALLLTLLYATVLFATTPRPHPVVPYDAQDHTTHTISDNDSHKEMTKIQLPGGDQAPELKIVSFVPDSSTVKAGAQVRLSWQVTGATEVTIDPEIGKVDMQGGVNVTVKEAIQYTLTARGVDGKTVTSVVNVGIAPKKETTKTPPAEQPEQQQPEQRQPVQKEDAPAPRPRILYFTATPDAVQAGGQVKLSWVIRNARSAVIDPAPGAVNQAAGSAIVTLSEATTYRLIVTGTDGSVVKASLTVQCAAPRQPSAVVIPFVPTWLHRHPPNPPQQQEEKQPQQKRSQPVIHNPFRRNR